jgi:hypothetical protein
MFKMAGNTEYETLLPYVIAPERIAYTIAVIVLDWSCPWSFLESLDRWLTRLGSFLEESQSKESFDARKAACMSPLTLCLRHPD